jgi:hypothetical protein
MSDKVTIPDINVQDNNGSVTKISEVRTKDTTAIGLMKYSQSSNLGDATQSLAALYCWWDALGRPENNFWSALQKVVTESKLAGYTIVWLDRDRMSESAAYLPPNITRVVTICNGWWMHYMRGREPFTDFPLPSFVVPLFTSVHINTRLILTDKTIKYFKEHEPIGCRDYYTSSLLNSVGVKSYFSGCLTTCIDLSIMSEGVEGVFNRFQGKTVIIDVSNSRRHFLGDCCFQSQMMDYAIDTPSCLIKSLESLLELRNANMVLTTRLHVWLPLVFNDCPVKILDPTRSFNELQIGARDFSYPASNRFGGNLEIAALSSELRNKWRANLLTETGQNALILLQRGS